MECPFWMMMINDDIERSKEILAVELGEQKSSLPASAATHALFTVRVILLLGSMHFSILKDYRLLNER